MAGKFLSRDAIIVSVKSEHRANAQRKRQKLTRHPISARSCGCPDPGCGAFHLIRTEQIIPTTAEAEAALAADKAIRKASRKAGKAKVYRKKRRHDDSGTANES